MLLVMTSVPTSESASLADAVIDSGLAGCVQIMPPMTSIFIWEGKVNREEESLLLIKTLPERYDELESLIREIHSYDVPEIAAVEMDRVSRDYASWLREVTGD